jgi:chaperone modulatory protein CbpM
MSTDPTRVYALAPAPGLSLDTVARSARLHPDLIRRYVALGLLDARRDASGRLRFDPSAPLVVARIQRLRAGLGLNYASVGLVLDLLDRIGALEADLRRTRARRNDTSWT